MNVGYTLSSSMDNLRKIECPVCGSNIYINKYNTDFYCTSEKCVLNKKWSTLCNKANEIFALNKGKQEDNKMSNTVECPKCGKDMEFTGIGWLCHHCGFEPDDEVEMEDADSGVEELVD